MSYTEQHLAEATTILQQIDHAAIEKMADVLATVRARGGRLFFLGVGGSAGNCGHAVNDFRKLAGFEAYAPTENTNTPSSLRSRLPFSHATNTVSHPSSLVRAVNSETLSVGA